MSYLVVFLFSWSAFAVEFQGRLFERGTKKNLSDVNVFLLPHKLKSITSETGNFSFSEVPEGDCTFVINLTGYQKYEKPCTSGTIYLEKISYTGFETTVTGKVTKRDDQGQTLTREEFMKAPGSFGGDPIRAAQNLPGVAQSGANAQIIIQGASPEDTGYVIDGHRVPIVFHFGGLSSVVIPDAVDRVDLLPSGFGPEYSRATGGIIGLTTKAPVKDRFHGMAFVDLLNAGALIEGPIDEKSSILIAGRYSYIGQVLKAVAKENEDFELTAAPSYYDFTTIYDRKLNEKNSLKTTIVASKDQLELVLNKAANNDPDLRGNFFNATEFFRVIPQITTDISTKTKVQNSLGLGHDSIFVDIGGRYLDIDSTVISQRSEIAHEWSEKSKTYFGLDNYWQQSTVSVNLPNGFSVGGVNNPFSTGETRKFSQEGSQTFLGIYLRQELKPSEESKWTYLPNVRVDHFTINQDTRVQPRFQLRYQLDPKLLLRGSWGQYVQTPQPQETSRLYGNQNIRSPYAWHYTLGFTKDFRETGSQGLELTNNYFYKDLKDLVYPDIQKNYSNSGTGSILGGEVQAKYRKDAWTSQFVYTYLKSTRHIPGFGTSPSEFDQTHNLNLIGSYNTERWTYSARFRYVTGNPYTPVTGGTFDADNDVYIPVRGDIYSRRFESFNQLDVRVDRKYIYDEWILTAYVDILNIYNSGNSQNIEYSYDYSQKKKVRGLPILPTIGLKGEF